MLPAPVHLACFPGLTRYRVRSALRFFGTATQVLDATKDELLAAGWKEPAVTDFLAWKKTFDPDAAADWLARESIETVSIEDTSYPPQLHDLYDPPLCLFVRGSLVRYTTSLAIVGTRNMTKYGSYIVDTMVPALTRAGITIVSGLAFGVDSAAHKKTIESLGHTIAVLGSGVDDRSIAPSVHRSLAHTIIQTGGAIMSEYPPGTQATKFTFPERNRIIAALSRATFVVEAGEKSGALITATSATELGKDVCTVPHPIHSQMGVGPNMLLKQGAHVITGAEDIITLLGVDASTTPASTVSHTFTSLESAIHRLLQSEATHVDEILASIDGDSSEIMSAITMMELQGTLKNMGNMMYIAC